MVVFPQFFYSRIDPRQEIITSLNIGKTAYGPHIKVSGGVYAASSPRLATPSEFLKKLWAGFHPAHFFGASEVYINRRSPVIPLYKWATCAS